MVKSVRDRFGVATFKNVLWRQDQAFLLEQVFRHVWVELDSSVDGVHGVELLRRRPASSRHFGREILRNRTSFQQRRGVANRRAFRKIDVVVTSQRRLNYASHNLFSAFRSFVRSFAEKEQSNFPTSCG